MQFYAREDEIADWIVESLPAKHAPYFFLRQEPAPRSGLSVREVESEELAASLARHRGKAHWVGSKVLSPDLDARDISRPEDVAKLNFRGLTVCCSKMSSMVGSA